MPSPASVTFAAKLRRFRVSIQDGPMVVALEFVIMASTGLQGHPSIRRSDVSIAWITGLMTTISDSAIAKGHPCRITLTNSMITEVGHASLDQWWRMAPPPPSVQVAKSGRVAEALAHINRRRIHQRDLAPGAWGDDDVIVEARRLGWT